MSSETVGETVGDNQVDETVTDVMDAETPEEQTIAEGEEAALSEETTTAEPVEDVHPCMEKLNAFKPSKWQLEKQIPQSSPPFEDETFTFVDTTTSLNEMMTELKKVKELAISVQYEKFTHFHQTCCVVEIATRTHDFVIDSIVLKDEIKVLNEVLTDESIVKVTYSNTIGFTMASTLGLWIVNLFVLVSARSMTKGLDKQLDYDAILKKHCFVDVPSLEPEADWNARPLPETLMKYARTRVHYMLYIHDIYRNELIKLGHIQKLYVQCNQFCKRPAKRDGFTPNAHITMYKHIMKKHGTLNKRQLHCFGLLFKWRYDTAKENDKGCAYVLPAADMFKIATELPTEVEGVRKCFPDEVLPPLVEANLQVVHELVLQAIKDVTDLSLVRFEDIAPAKRSFKPKNDPTGNSAKRGRGDFHRGLSGKGPIRGRGGFHRGQSIVRPSRGRGGFQHGRPAFGPMRGRGGMHSAMAHHMGPFGPGMGPMGQQMGPMYGHGMGPMSQMAPRMGQVSPGMLSDVVNEVVGEVIKHGMNFGNSMYGMNNQGYGQNRGGLRGRASGWR